jgi:hypothetical protein
MPGATLRSATDRLVLGTGLPLGYFICAPFALLAIWGHHYLPGVDLPEHAEMTRLWVDLAKGVPEVKNLYEFRWLTPYLVAFGLAYPVARWMGGALIGIKFVLSIAALGVPWQMTRWLKAVGGDPRIGIVGFSVVFGFAFIWGFMSQCLALALMFGYLASIEQPDALPGEGRSEAEVLLNAVLVPLLWGVALFFCHGITFGLAMVCAGLTLLVRPRPLRSFRSWIHFVPLAALTLTWMHFQEKVVGDKSQKWFADLRRVELLFAGFLTGSASLKVALIVLGVLAVAWLLARPGWNRRRAAWAPFVVTFGCFLILPFHIVGTDLVGPRFCVYVQAFAVGLVVAAPGRERRFEWAAVAVVLAGLLVLNYRIRWFNRELQPFLDVAAKVEPGADLETFQPHSLGESASFGFRSVSLAAAWVASERGGIVNDDYAARFNQPVRRKKKPFPTRYRYVFTLAEMKDVLAKHPDATLLAQSGKWSVYQRAPLTIAGFTVVRSGQDHGDLEVDLSADKKPLTVAGTVHEHGLGTQGGSWIQLRSPPGAVKLSGACGVDDEAGDAPSVTCEVRTVAGRRLFRSARLKKGEAPVPFLVTLPRDGGDILLEIAAHGNARLARADWLDLEAAAPN